MRNALLFALLVIALLGAVTLSAALGAVSVPIREVWQTLLHPESASVQGMILWQMRIPRTITAIIAGAGLAVAGLLMQTVFRNPLAGPYVLGVSSGASLGVALVLMLGLGSSGGFGVISAATVGAGVVMLLVLWLSNFCRSSVSLLVLGIMVGYLVDALVSLIIHFGDPDRLEAFVNWGFGSFGRVHWSDMQLLAGFVAAGIALCVPTLKYLNTVLLGEQAAMSLGISVKANRALALGAASILTAVTTVFCGPVGFIGLAVPHMARALFRTANHRLLLPASILIGAVLAVLAGWIANLPSHGGVLPLNAITAVVGVPVVFWAMLKSHGRVDD